MKKYTTLFCDVDNTLLDFYKAESTAIEQLFANYGIDNSKQSISLYSRTNEKYWKLFEKGEMTKEQILVERFAETLRLMGEDRDSVSMNKDYFYLLSTCHFLIDGADRVLASLKEKGYNIYATTNGVARTQYKRIGESALAPYFDDIFVSETAGAQKPSREYFDYALSQSAEKDRSKILVIGDSMSSDIKGGIDSGFDTCWYNAFGEEKLYEPTYIITDLQELNTLL